MNNQVSSGLLQRVVDKNTEHIINHHSFFFTTQDAFDIADPSRTRVIRQPSDDYRGMKKLRNIKKLKN